MYGKPLYCDIGYCLKEAEGGFAFQPPRTVFSTRSKPLGQRAIQNCPAVNSIERQLVEVPSPAGLVARLARKGGGLELEVSEKGTFVQPDKLREMLSLDPPERWRVANVPVLRLKLPFFFVTDEKAMLSWLPPFLSPAMRRWPGAMVAGRFPVTDWPQNLAWTLEWDRPGEELVLRQGEPLAYALFEFDNPNKRPRLVEAELTETLDEYRRGMDGIHHITPRIEEVWEDARTRRPDRLLVPLDG